MPLQRVTQNKSRKSQKIPPKKVTDTETNENKLRKSRKVPSKNKINQENDDRRYQRITSQRGAVISTKSYMELSDELLKDQCFLFVLGGRFTTELVENNFSVVRFSNMKPDALQFQNITR